MPNEPMILFSPDFEVLVNDYATQANAILGVRNAGKTYTATKAAEQLLDNGIPIIVFDPIGIWKNLKVGIDKFKGYQIVVAGGEGSDIKITEDNAAEIVRASMKANVSLIIDLYCKELINKSQWIKIVHVVADVLMYENLPFGMRHIFLEEAAEFIPQLIEPQHKRVYSSLERIARLGRNVGLGLTIINQRAAQVNKAILELCVLSLIHKQTGVNSLKSIQKWLEYMAVDKANERIINKLVQLKPGECFAIYDNIARQIKITPKKTFHPDPKKGIVSLPKNGKVVDVSDFVKKMNSILQEIGSIDSSDNSKSNEQIAALKKQVIALKNELLNKEQTIIELNTVQKKTSTWLNGFLDYSDKLSKEIKEYNNNALTHIAKEIKAEVLADIIKVTPKQPKASVSNQIPLSNKKEEVTKTNLPDGALKLLKTCATFYPNSINKTRLSVMSGVNFKVSTFRAYIALLKSNSLIEVVSKNSFCCTSKGVQYAGDFETIPTNFSDRIKMWCEKIGGGPAVYFRILADNYPTRLSIPQLASMAGQAYTKSTHRAYMAKLRQTGLIDEAGSGITIANELID